MDEYHYLSLLDEAIVTSPTGFTSKAHFSLWKPKEEGFKQNEEEKSGIVPNESDSDVFVSALKIFSFKHIVESADSALRALCLLPTSMNKIFIQVN